MTPTPPTSREAPLLLAFDAGNTRLSVGLFNGDNLVAVHHWPREQAADPAWLSLALGDALASAGTAPAAVGAIAAASVVRAVSASLAAVCHELLGREPFFLNADAPYGMNLGAVDAGRMGADRLAAAAFAVHAIGAPVIVVDAGTAITVDLVDAGRAYRGGAILPGLRLMYAALHRGTDLLPELAPALPQGPVGTTTRAAMHAGIGFAAAGAIERLVAEQREVAGAAPVVLTGGLAPLVAPLLRVPVETVSDLVLRGVALVAGRASWQPLRRR